MGTSFVEFHQRGFWVRDCDLCIWLAAVVQVIDRQPASAAWLTRLRQQWHLQAILCSTGCVSADLDALVTTGQQKDDLLLLSQQAINNLATEGKVISADCLNAMLRDEAIIPGDNSCVSEALPVETFLHVGRAFLLLLQGDVFPMAPPFPVLGSQLYPPPDF